jgi:flavin reductase (DIM6/NTAB) family NADH-FMN oxidoreductase RutF
MVIIDRLRLSLPEAAKRRLNATRQWVAIALPPGEAIVDVKLVTSRGVFDVTGNNAVAALWPLTVRFALDAQLQAALAAGRARLDLVDRKLGRVIGRLTLRHRRDWEVAGATIGLCEVLAGTHYCAPWPRRLWDSWLHRRAALRKPFEERLMSPAAIEHLLTFYLCPRPVFLVGVSDGSCSNLFPMDLVGPLPSGIFTLALRNTSVSVETIKSDRRLALSDVPASAVLLTYQLGVHHKHPSIDGRDLPFKLLRSELFCLPVPDFALRVREVEIIDFQTIGSHTLFVGRFCSERFLAECPQLFQTSGAHQRLRSRHDRPFKQVFPLDAG